MPLPVQLPGFDVVANPEPSTIMADNSPDIDSLYKEFSGKTPVANAKTVPDVSHDDIDALHKEFSGQTTPPVTQTPLPQSSDIGDLAPYNRQSFVRGISDVLDTMAHGAGNAAEFVGDNLLPTNMAKSIRDENQEFNAADLAKRNQYEQTNPNASGTDYNRLIGQTAATLPLVPAKAVQLWKGAMGALPLASKVAAPFINRLAGAVGEGAIGGGTFGAATADSNNNSTASNIGEGIITGAIAGPALHAAGEAASQVIPTLSALWNRVNVNKLASSAGIDANVARNIIDRLNAAGYSPQQAQLGLNKLGPKATLMDLDNSLTTEGSGLASMSGAPTAILKNRMEARAVTANNDTVNLFKNTLGPKPDVDASKEKIVKDVQKAVEPDYKAAYNSGAKLDIGPVAKNINSQLETAVGGKRNALMMAKNWLFKDAQTAQGEPIKVLKNKVSELHEIRMGLDDAIEGKEPETSAGKNTLRALKDVRGKIDDELKSIPEFANADEKFADKMKVVQGFDVGKEAIEKRIAHDDFAKTYNSSLPETKDTIAAGMLHSVYDYLELAQRGELTGATQLFGKNSAKRNNLRLAFGNKADQVLDALEKEANFRSTENAIRSGSQTAERRAVQERYKAKEGTSHTGDLMRGALMDVLGGQGIGTGIALIKRGGSKVMSNVSGNRLERLIEGTADIISQQGPEAQKTLDTLKTIADKSKTVRKKSTIRLPIQAATPIAYSQRKQIRY